MTKSSDKNPRTRVEKAIDRFICFCRWFQFAIQDRILLWWGRRYWRYRNNPLVSIVIPTRNRWELLKKRAVPSLMAQTYTNWELIIVDDGSKDFCFWGLPTRKHAIKVYPIEKKFHYPKNAWCRWCAGPVRALNHALSKVEGDYILRMNDHDILLPNALMDLLSLLYTCKYESVSATHTKNGKKVKPYLMRGELIGGIQTTLMRSYLKRFKYNPDCWRKKWNSPNDIDLMDRMLRVGVATAYLTEVVSEIKSRPEEENLVGWAAQKKFYDTKEKM